MPSTAVGEHPDIPSASMRSCVSSIRYCDCAIRCCNAALAHSGMTRISSAHSPHNVLVKSRKSYIRPRWLPYGCQGYRYLYAEAMDICFAKAVFCFEMERLLPGGPPLYAIQMTPFLDSSSACVSSCVSDDTEYAP